MKMMRILIVVILSLSVFLTAKSALAGGGCPQVVDHLEQLAGCLVPARGGMRYAGTEADFNAGGDPVFAAMNRTAVVPPQVHNGMAGVISPMFPAYPISSAMAPMMGATAYVAASRGNYTGWNYMNFYMGMPIY